jgi:leukotriene-A4 hydrolase
MKFQYPGMLKLRLSLQLIGIFVISSFLYAQEGSVQQIDPHSFSKPNEVVVKHLHLDIRVDFQQKKIIGKASLQILNKTGAIRLYLDTNGLSVSKVTLDDGVQSSFELGETEAPMGQPLVVSIRPETKVAHVEYSTSPDAAALQWLEPAQTEDEKYPFLYTQSQAILARSWVPCQDTPSVRMTYTAKVQVPTNLLAVMSAENPTKKNESGLYEFRMPQPIPSYLLALAVGDIAFRSTGERTGVYAEPSIIEKAAWEFAETPQMMETVEKLYGPYQWGRYDLIVLPPSFPWGGMENPRLTFVTPTLLAGDRSLVATIAHELAHSWSGNLVTNATWNDFWLNEGFTNYLTHRIMEKVYGEEYAKMLAVLQLQDLRREVAEIGPKSPDTHLKMNLAGRDPEIGVTAIPYDKGEFFLFTLEAAVGREKWDAFLNQYFQQFAFQSVTSEQFLSYLQKNLIASHSDLEKKIQPDAWIYGPGIPQNILRVDSVSLKQVDQELAAWLKGGPIGEVNTKEWSTHHWIHFIRALPESVSAQKMEELDKTFRFTTSKNAEILSEWLRQVILKRYAPAYPAIEKFLTSQGRRKYVKLLFTELVRTEEGREMAKLIYDKARPLYHSVARETAERVLRGK